MINLVLRLAQLRILPVAVIERADDAWCVAQAVKAGGLLGVEVTLRTPAAAEAIRVIAADPDLLVGAGTVIRAQQVEEVVEAGAQFVVTPGFSRTVVRRCQQLGIPVLPGVATATEIQLALDAGIDVVKLFPAGPLGGASMIHALSAAYSTVRFVPTGGVTAANMHHYLDLPAVICVAGSWMVTSDLVTAGRFDEITARTAEAVSLAGGVRTR